MNDSTPGFLPQNPQSWEQLHEFYAVELQCRSIQESDSSFAGRVEKDIDKVLNTDWHRRLTSEHAASVAISLGDSQLEEMMYNAAKEKGIMWQMVELSEIYGIRIWTYEHRLRGLANQALFSYSN